MAEIVAVALTPNGIQMELNNTNFRINRLQDYYKVIGNGCTFVTPVTIAQKPRLTMWVDEDAKMKEGMRYENPFAAIILASFTHRHIDIAGTVIFTGAVSHRIAPIHKQYLDQLREIEQGRADIVKGLLNG